MKGFSLVVHGSPVGQPRPRFRNGHAYASTAQRSAEGEWKYAWEQAGQPRIDGPLRLELTLFVQRPVAHYLRNGSLSLVGGRHPFPERKKPDVDNALKLSMDSLNRLAWEDDVRVVDAHVRRLWTDDPASASTTPRTVLIVEAM